MKIDFEKKTKGVSFDKKTGKFRVRLTTATKRLFLGRFESKRDAIIARKVGEQVARSLSL